MRGIIIRDVIVTLLLPLLVCSNNETPYVKMYTKEHKVHNIMLYPEKHSWCRPTPIKQIVSHPGCHSIEMTNNVCVGACFSFSVPGTIPKTPGDDLLYYCDSCQSNKVTWTTVQLDCPENIEEKSFKKMVELIENCSCMSFPMKQDKASQESQFSGESPENEEDFSDENNNVIEIHDKANRLRHHKELSSTNSSSMEENFLSAENISMVEKILKYTDQDPDELIEELQMKIDEDDE